MVLNAIILGNYLHEILGVCTSFTSDLLYFRSILVVYNSVIVQIIVDLTAHIAVLFFVSPKCVLSSALSVDPGWGSCSLGVFICLDCSGIHRNILNINKVKSLSLSHWEDHEVQVRQQNSCF